jgi:hypothetical protein
MKDYILENGVYKITLENEKIVKVGKNWVDKTIKLLDTDLEDVLLMWLEDNDYLINEELEELNQKAKENKVKLIATDKAKKKTQKERVIKENPTKEIIIKEVYTMLSVLNGVSDITIENKTKIITFSLNGENFKLDLVQKRKPKEK